MRSGPVHHSEIRSTNDNQNSSTKTNNNLDEQEQGCKMISPFSELSVVTLFLVQFERQLVHLMLITQIRLSASARIISSNISAIPKAMHCPRQAFAWVLPIGRSIQISNRFSFPCVYIYLHHVVLWSDYLQM